MTATVALHDWDALVPAAAIKNAGFDRVVLCVEDRHVIYRQDNVVAAVEELQKQGLEVLVNPWGVGGHFAGETMHRTDVDNAVPEFIALAVKAGAEGILWDEPKAELPDYVVHDWLMDAQFSGLKNVMALQPERDLEDWDDADELTVSTYFFGDSLLDASEEDILPKLDEWDDKLPEGASVWIQTWGLPNGQEWVPDYLIKAWTAMGRDVNVWSWNAMETVSKVRSFDHMAVWGNTLLAIKHHVTEAEPKTEDGEFAWVSGPTTTMPATI